MFWAPNVLTEVRARATLRPTGRAAFMPRAPRKSGAMHANFWREEIPSISKRPEYGGPFTQLLNGFLQDNRFCKTTDFCETTDFATDIPPSFSHELQAIFDSAPAFRLRCAPSFLLSLAALPGRLCGARRLHARFRRAAVRARTDRTSRRLEPRCTHPASRSTGVPLQLPIRRRPVGVDPGATLVLRR